MERSARAAEALIVGSTPHEGLGHAIRAAELYMRAASEPCTTRTDAIRLRRRCKELIAYAERLKAQLPQGEAPGANILKAASHLNGNEFPPWKAEPAADEFRCSAGGKPFCDDATFALSAVQEEISAGWRRPHELFECAEGPGHEDMVMDVSGHACLMQDITTDCSVVASLCAAAHILTGRRLVLSSIFYPFDYAKGRPQLSANGKYLMRLHFNGCSRRVVIDDRLPASLTDRSLFVFDRCNRSLLWPALLEKAYLKVRGGYDFPGSNSGTDLWVMTGWVPEQLFLQREDLDISETWARIKSAHDSEDVIITVGTGVISAEEEKTMGLVGEHDYAVQQLDDSDGVRKLLLKNPWFNGPELRMAGWSLPGRSRVNLSTAAVCPNAVQGEDVGQTNGLLWVALEDVAQSFESMYLNWNPALFRHRQDHHFAWKIPPAFYTAALTENPQFSICSSTGDSIWILVSRHFSDAELEIARQKTGSMASVSGRLGFMSLLIFDNDGKRVQVGEGWVYRGAFVDSPQTLARFDASPGKPYTVVLDQHGFPLSSYTFTMSLFSSSTLQVRQAVEPMTHATERFGSWTRRTAGGNASHTTYFLNPQFSLTLSQPSPLCLLLCPADRDVHVHVDLVWAGGERATTVRAKDLLVSSGEYRRGCAVADLPRLEPGVYTVVCSTFEAGQQAEFALRVTSMVPVTLKAVPADAAGRLRTSLTAFQIKEGEEKRRASLSVSRLTRACISVRAAPFHGSEQATRHSSVLLIRLSVVHGQGPEETTIAISGDGEYQETTTALRTNEFDLEPDRIRQEGLWLVIESLGARGGRQAIEGDIFSDCDVQIGPWEQC